MNSNQYSCNVVIAGLMAQLCLPERKPSVPIIFWGPVDVIFWDPNEIELRFRYGGGVVSFYDINNRSLQKKRLGTEHGGWYTFFFSRSEGFMKASLI